MSKCFFCGDKGPIEKDCRHYCKECYWKQESNKDRDSARWLAVIMGIPTIALAVVIAFRGIN